MKSMFSILAITVSLMACNHETEKTETVNQPGTTIVTDTTGLAEFQAYKAAKAHGFIKDEVAEAKARNNTTARKSSSRKYSSSNSTVYKSGSATVTPEQQKKGWSHAAKGAVIGAGSGAILGAAINKNNRVAGGVVGGVVGGAVGYGIGRSKDKKEGRY